MFESILDTVLDNPAPYIFGAVALIIVAVGSTLYRQRLIVLFRDVVDRFRRAREGISRGNVRRYLEGIQEAANSMHVAGHLIALEEVAVQPRFLKPRPPFNPLEDDLVIPGPLSLVPVTPNFPQVASLYRVPGVNLKGILRKGGRVALLGLPGSGRSTTLALLAIRAAREHGSAGSRILSDDPLMPIIANFNDFDFDNLGTEEDPSIFKPLMVAAQRTLKNIPTRLMVVPEYDLYMGNALILLDGWEELDSERQLVMVEWLKTLIEHYPYNKIVVTGPPTGYGDLQDAGLAPLFMAGWSQADFNELAEYWAQGWTTIGAKPDQAVYPPDEPTMRRALRSIERRNPLDATLKVWATYAQEQSTAHQHEWYSAYLRRVTRSPEMLPALYEFAKEVIYSGEPLTLDRLTSLVQSTYREVSGDRTARPADYIYSLLNESRILAEYADGHIDFRNPAVGAYLMAQTIGEATPIEDLVDPDNRYNPLVVAFLAQVYNIKPFVRAKLSEKPTLLNSTLLELAAWLVDAPREEEWRAEVLREYAKRFLSASIFPLVREQLMAALVATNDYNVTFVFKQGMKAPNPALRLLSAIGLGAIGDSENVADLVALLDDPDASVKTAAALALGAIGTQPAIEQMLNILMTADEMPRWAVAEMFATDRAGDGHQIIREALDEQDGLTRKVAVTSLERIEEDWILELLEDHQTHDSQFIIRSRATDILERLRTNDVPTPERPPEPHEIPWITTYYTRTNQEVKRGAGGIAQVIGILEESDEAHKLAAAEVLGAIGAVDGIPPLYNMTRESHPELRDAAYRALGNIGLITGTRLPPVV